MTKTVKKEIAARQQNESELMTPKQVNAYTISFMILTAFFIVGFIAG